MAIDTPRILLIDSYDSFSYNLASLLRRAIPGCRVHIIKNDKLNHKQFLQSLPHFSAIVVGPGPGSPAKPEDIGFIEHLWQLSDEDVRPIFGVCLGLQTMCIQHGARIKRLNVVKHGQVSKLQHCGASLFEGVEQAEVVRYHSLHVQLDGSVGLEALAWADDGADNGRVVMAAKHRTKPYYAVQYHPESTRTHGGGIEVVQNFWSAACRWWSQQDRSGIVPWSPQAEATLGPPWPAAHLLESPTLPTDMHYARNVVRVDFTAVIQISEALGAAQNGHQPFALLQSAAHPGRFSILACPTSIALNIQYSLGDLFVRLKQGQETRTEPLGDETIWSWISRFMTRCQVPSGPDDCPFWGGLVGMLGYELGVQELGVQPSHKPASHPDVNLLFVERSIVFDKQDGAAYIQSLLPDDDLWLSQTAEIVYSHNRMDLDPSNCPPVECQGKAAHVRVEVPDKTRYLDGIRSAKDSLFAGNSYELCVTGQTRITLPPSSAWERYKMLHATNPAPYSAFLRLSPTTFLASSPERFMSCSRSPDVCLQFRPIKGTLRKHPDIKRADAESQLAGSPKEVAENLMIVDLIRHDLHGVVGENVEVRKFCSIEEYETVWQMVSVIEGRLPGHSGRHVGWETLRRSLPPGSMTGAPKKRSVEILQTLEDKSRGLYSGVFGYWCVSGASDWSVTIRTCIKHDEDATDSEETWTVGAGGAITALSEPEAEWDEMLTKLQSVLRCFGANITL